MTIYHSDEFPTSFPLDNRKLYNWQTQYTPSWSSRIDYPPGMSPYSMNPPSERMYEYNLAGIGEDFGQPAKPSLCPPGQVWDAKLEECYPASSILPVAIATPTVASKSPLPTGSCPACASAWFIAGFVGLFLGAVLFRAGRPAKSEALVHGLGRFRHRRSLAGLVYRRR